MSGGHTSSARARSIALALLLGSALAPPARAAAPAALAIRLTTVKDRAVAALDVSSVFEPSRQQEFGNGLTNLVEIYTSVVPVGGGAASSIHGRIIEKRDQGTAVLLVSSELDEILALSDRIAVMYRGQIVEIVPALGVNREYLGLLMAGVKPEEARATVQPLTGQAVVEKVF